MFTQYRNFAFSGGGILGIAYIGMLDYLYKVRLMQSIQRVAGTSAGAITACLTSFNLPFDETKRIADSLEYSKVASKTAPDSPESIPVYGKLELDGLLGNFDCVYRLIKNYGWYSSCYLYDWIKRQIEAQFDTSKKAPPYTFTDFKNPAIHKGGNPFKALYIIGADVSTQTSSVFSAEYTPDMEVAEAVRISMSVPLFFEAIKSTSQDGQQKVFADGGLLYNYPITLFDKDRPTLQTLGALFKSSSPPAKINNILDFIVNLLSCTSAIQMQLFNNSPKNKMRSIQIETGEVPPLDFDVKVGSDTYNFLYQQGYKAAETYFQRMSRNMRIS